MVRPLWAIVSPLHYDGDFTLFLYQEKSEGYSDAAVKQIYRSIETDRDFQPLKVGEIEYDAINTVRHFESSGFYNATLVGFSASSGIKVSAEELEKYTR